MTVFNNPMFTFMSRQTKWIMRLFKSISGKEDEIITSILEKSGSKLGHKIVLVLLLVFQSPGNC